MNASAAFENCPSCGDASSIRPKLLLVDEAWVPAPGKDPRLAYFADLRVDDVKPSHLQEPPLQQFVEGFYCDRCGRGFISEEVLLSTRRRYR
jgi:hypothetical protein